MLTPACNSQALTFAKEIFGADSLEMVPPYLLLSQANLGLGRLLPAEEFLSSADWVILKTPGCSNTVRSQLHRHMGKLYTAQNKVSMTQSCLITVPEGSCEGTAALPIAAVFATCPQLYITATRATD